MKRKTHSITHAAIIAAMYFALTHLQNLLIPNSATWAIQFRASEALCVLSFFTPAAVPGLTIGCLLFNISFAGALPLDFAVGALPPSWPAAPCGCCVGCPGWVWPCPPCSTPFWWAGS